MKTSQNAQMSVSAVLGLPEVDAYSDEMLGACVVKPDGHEKPPKEFPPKDRLWSITTIARSAKYGGTRTVCVCDSFGRAKEIVETNEGDIWECSYMLVVIEEFDANSLYGGLGTQVSYWYRWNIDAKSYEAIETPEVYEHIVGWGIG